MVNQAYNKIKSLQSHRLSGDDSRWSQRDKWEGAEHRYPDGCLARARRIADDDEQQINRYNWQSQCIQAEQGCNQLAAPAATTKNACNFKAKWFKLNIRRYFKHCNAITVGVAIQFVHSLLWFHISCWCLFSFEKGIFIILLYFIYYILLRVFLF